MTHNSLNKSLGKVNTKCNWKHSLKPRVGESACENTMWRNINSLKSLHFLSLWCWFLARWVKWLKLRSTLCMCCCTCVSINVYLLVHANTHLYQNCYNPPFRLLHLNDSTHCFSRMSGEDAAALTSSLINTRSLIMSALAPDPWQALSKAGQRGINTQIIHTACRGSVLSHLKWTHLLL